MAGILFLVPIYLAGEPRLLRQLGVSLGATFGLTVEVHPPWFDPELAFAPERGQYHSTMLLEQLQAGPGSAPAERVLGVTSVDLFIPVLSYVFGEAEVGGRSAVISLARLSPEAYGLPASPERVIERAIKEAHHELGHTRGLLHCQSPACVMRSSTYVEEIDLKPAWFCPRCRALL